MTDSLLSKCWTSFFQPCRPLKASEEDHELTCIGQEGGPGGSFLSRYWEVNRVLHLQKGTVSFQGLCQDGFRNDNKKKGVSFLLKERLNTRIALEPDEAPPTGRQEHGYSEG